MVRQHVPQNGTIRAAHPYIAAALAWTGRRIARAGDAIMDHAKAIAVGAIAAALIFAFSIAHGAPAVASL